MQIERDRQRCRQCVRSGLQKQIEVIKAHVAWWRALANVCFCYYVTAEGLIE